MLLALAAAAPVPAETALQMPVDATCISSPFGMRGRQMHNGIDLPAPAGAWVRAVAAGRVVAIRRRGASGLEVELRHADGRRSRYAHLGTVTPPLAEGKRDVAQGERLGRVGRTGTTRGTHLHFEFLVDEMRVDAAPLLKISPCRRESP